MATYALEGFLSAVLADDACGRQWQENWEVLAVPFLDKDGVENGDSGKNRAPHDHNRDYNEQPLYPEIAALMKQGAKWQLFIPANLAYGEQGPLAGQTLIFEVELLDVK